MGKGRQYHCKNCGNDYSVFLGIGFLFPQEFKNVQEKVRKGRYGKKWKALIDSEEFVVADAEKRFFYCESCKAWKVTEDLSLYAPNDPEALKKKKFGDKTVEEWGEIPYVYGEELEQEYHLLQKRTHRCPRCRKGMICFSEEQMENHVFDKLSCPRCGEENESAGILMWD